MLNLITKSKIRQRLLLLFLYNPAQEYYINQAAKLVKTSAGTTQRELEKLVSWGIFKKEKMANLAYFRVNTENSLFADVKNIVNKTIGVEYLLKRALAEHGEIEFAFLFGSCVKGDFKPDSDIDLYVIGNIKEDKIYQALKQVEKKIMREINYHLASRDEFKKNLKKSFFHKDILSYYLLLVGNKNEFRKYIKPTA